MPHETAPFSLSRASALGSATCRSEEKKKLAVQKYCKNLISAITVLENLKECRGLAGVAVA